MYDDSGDGAAFCSGVFNGIHPEHLKLIRYASELAPRVVIGINGDAYNQRKNGERAIPVVDRMFLLKSIRFVDEVIVFEENDPSELILSIRPRYVVRGPDYQMRVLAEQAACDLVGARIVFRPGTYTYSSNKLFRSADPERGCLGQGPL